MKKEIIVLCTVALSCLLVAKSAYAKPTISNGVVSNDSNSSTYEFNYSGSVQNYRVYLDTDKNMSTGFSHDGIGAEFLIENGKLYKYTDSTGTKTLIGKILYASNTGGKVKYTVDRNAIGEILATGESTDLIFEISNSNVTLNLPKITQIYSEGGSTPPSGSLPLPIPCKTGGPCFVPKPGASWQWQISRDNSKQGNDYVDITPAVSFFDIDGFENGNGGANDVVANLHKAGKKVICYLDVGSYENWRADMATLKKDHPEVIGSGVPGWPGQWWLDFRVTDVVYPIMEKRISMCAEKGFDGVQYDDLVAYEEKNGGGFAKPISEADTIAFGAWLANTAHKYGLSAAFENAIEIADKLEPYYDWAIFEECHVYKECTEPGLMAFVNHNKWVSNVAYTDKTHDMKWCSSLPKNVLGIYKKRDLNSWIQNCP